MKDKKNTANYSIVVLAVLFILITPILLVVDYTITPIPLYFIMLPFWIIGFIISTIFISLLIVGFICRLYE